MWVSIFVTNDKGKAEEIMARLDNEGIMNRIRPMKDKKLERQIEIQVLESEAVDAQQILFS